MPTPMPLSPRSRQRQQGMVLVVCMLVVLVVSLIAISSTGTSAYQERAATNAQTYNRTFQAAETGVGTAAEDLTMMLTAMDDDNCLSGSSSVTTTTSGVTATAEVRFRNMSHTINGEIGQELTYRFEAIGIGQLTDLNNTTTIRQGFNRISSVTEINEIDCSE